MEYITKLLVDYGLETRTAGYLANVIMILLITGLSMVANFITKKIVLRIITHYINNNRYTWDNIILEKKVFQKLSHIVPALIIYYFASVFPSYQIWIEKAAVVYIMVVMILVLDSFLNAVNAIYQTFEVSKIKPIKGYLQVVKIFIFIIGGILIIANLIGQSPLILLSGIGALSAVLMLVFRDSLLGLVAGVQLTTNDMVRVGDWIEMPKYGADGDVIDISLNTVKVMNFDKTITTIPSYALISDSFRNWRGMQASGGRRIKRPVYIDTSSIKFCTDEMIEKFKSIHYLADYISAKEEEIRAYNEERQIDTSNRVNGRAMTNIGVFRIYIENYLKQHPKIHKGMSLMVRQLEPGEHGLPLEIYAFSNDTNWVNYEGVQSDIFDHIFAIAPEFGLRLFQNPTGHDLQNLMRVNQPSS
ncbi:MULTISPECIES: mechanosensitive ion channel family protein [Paenibacillus]|uniref:Mechanosensing system component YbdG n=1 Tax=Paenibacillus campinasensis TaxID=66347 RepID=A0A268F0H5_9BACL|nr:MULTISPECIES: mechanosensitive ion channel family protein [Paenibacillus]MUG65585.1 mechanosensitive ion channel [Paenibacillus campinasensis]PAD78887.1 mechanosensitive ion channel protein MscS [Paenibacillus campinasensis]PAK53863.1 mechanosensitive ion channel protein MscS [Paenibacillus sp. 7541]